MSARTAYLPLPPLHAALAVACGGDPEVRRRGTAGLIHATGHHESVAIVYEVTRRYAEVPAAIMEALVVEAPRIAQRRRDAAAEARAQAASLLASAEADAAKAAAIDAVLAALRGAT